MRVFFSHLDTDSLIYAAPEGANPLQTSTHLGGLTDEYPMHRIVEVVSGGSKQYGLKLQRIGAADNEFEYVLKIRGMTLNWDVLENQGLRYETFKNRVLHYSQTGQIEAIPVLYPTFLRPSIIKSHVISEPLRKIWKPFVGKGIVQPSSYRVLDFGYIAPST